MKLTPRRSAVPSMLTGAVLVCAPLVLLGSLVLGLTRSGLAGWTAASAGGLVALVLGAGMLPLWWSSSRSPGLLRIVALGWYAAQFVLGAAVVAERGQGWRADHPDTRVGLVTGVIIALAGWLAGMSIGLMNSRTTVDLPYDAVGGDPDSRHTGP